MEFRQKMDCVFVDSVVNLKDERLSHHSLKGILNESYLTLDTVLSLAVKSKKSFRANNLQTNMFPLI